MYHYYSLLPAIVSLLFFYNDGFDIKWTSKVDILLNTESETFNTLASLCFDLKYKTKTKNTFQHVLGAFYVLTTPKFSTWLPSCAFPL